MSTTSEIPVGSLSLTALVPTSAQRIGSATQLWSLVSAKYQETNWAALAWSDVETTITGLSAATKALIISALVDKDAAALGNLWIKAVTANNKSVSEAQVAAAVGTDSITLIALELVL